VTLTNLLILGALIFAIGAVGVLTRRNLIFIFMSLELMFGGVGLTLVAFSRYLTPAEPLGLIFVIFMLAIAAGETALGLGIFLAVNKNSGTVQADEIKNLKG